MSPIWSSSEGPISVRTVWIDGVRHPILTHDDPILSLKNPHRPQTTTATSKSKVYPVKYMCRETIRIPENLDSCFFNFHVIVNKKHAEIQRKYVTRRQSAPINRIETTRSLKLELSGTLKIRDKNEASNEAKTHSDTSTRKNLKGNCEDSNYTRNDEDFGKNYITFSDDFKDNCANGGINCNPLSERVLRWMDMSGCVKHYNEKGEINTRHGVSNQKSLVRAKVCSFRRQNLPVSRDLASLQNYKLSKKKSEDSIADINIENTQGSRNEERNEVSNEKKNVWKCPNSSESGKSVCASMGRPQLHIFMPDLNSSGEDPTYEDSLALEESPNQNDVN